LNIEIKDGLHDDLDQIETHSCLMDVAVFNEQFGMVRARYPRS